MISADPLLQEWHAIDARERGVSAEDPKGKGGRPRGRFDPNIDWDLAERLFVEGELVGEGETTHRVYPSYGEIAKRAHTSKANIQQRIRRYNWIELREKFKSTKLIEGMAEGRVRTSDGKPARLLEMGIDPANPAKKGRRSPEKILLSYINQFDLNLRKGAVRCDTVGDFEKAVRLLAFVRGEAESTKTLRHEFTLEQMTQRHKEHRARVQRLVDDDVAGVLGVGEQEHDIPDAEIVEPAGEGGEPGPRLDGVIEPAAE